MVHQSRNTTTNTTIECSQQKATQLQKQLGIITHSRKQNSEHVMIYDTRSHVSCKQHSLNVCLPTDVSRCDLACLEYATPCSERLGAGLSFTEPGWAVNTVFRYTCV